MNATRRREPAHRRSASIRLHMATPRVTVTGEASVPARPDEVRIALRLRELRDTADDALTRVAGRSEGLRALLDELGVPEASRTTSGVMVREEREYERNRWVNKGFAAEARTIVRLTDPAILGRLITQATARADAQVDGPWWRILPDNPARLEACRQAARDARLKAEAYAASLGAQLGPIAWIRESSGEYAPMPRPAFALAARATGPEQAEMDVEPGEMDVSASVSVSFDLQQA
jgi:uncharacterized protein YggE